MAKEFDNQHLRHARSQGVQVAAAVSLYGISFGALSVALGFSVWQTIALSALMFSGASQFAFIGIMAGGGAAAGGAAIAASGMLGVRNGLYALRMSPVIEGGFLKRAVAAQLTIDESTAVAIAQTDVRAQRAGFWTTGIAIYLGWNAMTLVGAVVGDQLGDPKAYGLDAVAAAAFLALLWSRLQALEPVVMAVAAAALTVALIPFVPSGVPILVVAFVAVITAIIRHRQDPQRPDRREGGS